MNSKEKIIIFDLWQTLADSELKPSDLFNKSFQSDEKVSREFCLDKLFKSDLYLKNITLEDGLSKLLLDLDLFNKKNLEETILIWKKMAEKSFLITGAMELLLDLKVHSYKLCLLTNIDKYGYENFPFKSFFEIFDYRFLSYENGIIKPDAKCWKIIRDHYQTDYRSMVMIGDSKKNDIEPAKKLGISTILINVAKKNEIYTDVYEKLIKQ